VNIQVYKRRHNVLQYITEEDEEALFNCRESELSFTYRAKSWARPTQTFHNSELFIYNSRFPQELFV